MRQHISGLLSGLYAIKEATDGDEALRLCNDIIPDLIISDIKMPRMDGYELLQALKNSENTSHVPVILLTAKASDEDRLKGVKVGADAYITKPFDGKLLLATVKNLIDTRKRLIDKFKRNLSLEPSDITITSLDEKFLKRAIDNVEINISNPDYSVDSFSKDMGMSRSHLHRKFVGLTGLSPSGFIRLLRMKRAAQFLTKGQLTVSEILFEVGIKSRSYFIKSFKEQFGLSPTDFVANHRANQSNTSLLDL
jgi:YesN/AraC family two-component response regulator